MKIWLLSQARRQAPMLAGSRSSHLSHVLVSLFLGLGVVSIGMNEEMMKKPNLHSQENLSRSVAPAALEVTPWLDKAAQLSSLEGFLKISSGVQERKLILSLADDELTEGSPFAKLSSHYPLAVILSKGVKSFQRSTYRATGFRGESGYDLVIYEIVHTNGSHSEIMAYLDKGDDAEISEGAFDRRSEFVLFSLYESSGTNSINLYRESELLNHGSVASGEAMAMVSRRVNASVPFMKVGNL